MQIKVNEITRLKIGRMFFAYSELNKPLKIGPIKEINGDELLLDNGLNVTVQWLTQDQWMEIFKDDFDQCAHIGL